MSRIDLWLFFPAIPHTVLEKGWIVNVFEGLRSFALAEQILIH